MSQPSLFRYNKDRAHIVSEVCQRTYSAILAETRRKDDEGIEYLLNEAAFQEVERLQGEQGPEDEIHSISWWRDVSRRLGEMSESQKRTILRELAQSYTEDITGSFDPRVYRLATGALPVGLGMLFKAQDLRQIPFSALHMRKAFKHLRDLSERIVIEGHVDTLRHLARRGTLVFLPTHSSNMDSILMGWTLFQAGLPPVTYGAGKNLFTNPLTSFFMQNLGAYKVDRRIKHSLYKELLKTYSQVLLERGYHSLFFPGGTRSRSNKVEEHIKLGLLGTTITAYTNGLLSHKSAKPIYLCPVTINYNLVLEAESLIRDHLRREGGRRYFLEDDEFNQLNKVFRFALNTMQMSSTTVMRFGEPMDPFGNPVDLNGTSFDARGRAVDPTSYVRKALTGEVCHDISRDHQYTRHTGECVRRAFLKNTVLMPVHLVAFVLFELLQQKFPRWDVYRLLRLAGGEIIAGHRAQAKLDALLVDLKARETRGELRISNFVRDHTCAEIFEEGCSYLRTYHSSPLVEPMMNGVTLNKLDLLYYYGNRVRSFPIDLAAIAPNT